MNSERSFLKDTLVIGFAIFAIFFGAGNLIFPPSIGLLSGSSWGMGMVGLTLTGVLLPVLAVIAIGNMGGDLRHMSKKIAPWFFDAFWVICMVIALGVTMPRTGAVAYGSGFCNIFPGANNVTLYIFTAVYFALAFFFAKDKSSVMDKVGKILTPLLLLILLFIVIMTFIKPIGTPIAPQVPNVFANGFLTGYQTGDLVTGLLCGSFFIAAMTGKGYTEGNGMFKICVSSVFVAFLGLFIVYGGLLALGAQGSSIFGKDMDFPTLLISIVRELLGTGGSIALSISVILACLTTTTGMFGTLADVLSGWCKGKVPYTVLVAIIAVICGVGALGGVARIAFIAGPLFMLIYPAVIVMTILGLGKKFVPNSGAWKGGVLAAGLIGIYDAFAIMKVMGLISFGMGPLENLYAMIPLSQYGFAWIVPSVIGIVIGSLLGMSKGKNAKVTENV